MFRTSLKAAIALSLASSTTVATLQGAPAEASTIGDCTASTIGTTSQIKKVVEKSASGTASSGREFNNGFVFVAPQGYMISSVNVRKLKGGNNASYSENGFLRVEASAAAHNPITPTANH